MKDRKNIELSTPRERKRSGRAKAATIQRKQARQAKWHAQGRGVR